MTVAAEVFAALSTVRDPELDEPVTELGFVASSDVDRDGNVEVHLRLPTYFCAPNFAYLMVADAYDAVSALDGVASARIVLDEHFASDAINAGVARRAGFVGTFGDEAESELDELRAGFTRKAVMAGTEQVCRPLRAAGRSDAELAAMRLGDVPPSAALDRLRARRSELGLPTDDDAPLLVDPASGGPLDTSAVPLHLRKDRLTGVNIEANRGVCVGMLKARYGVELPHRLEEVEV